MGRVVVQATSKEELASAAESWLLLLMYGLLHTELHRNWVLSRTSRSPCGYL